MPTQPNQEPNRGGANVPCGISRGRGRTCCCRRPATTSLTVAHEPRCCRGPCFVARIDVHIRVFMRASCYIATAGDPAQNVSFPSLREASCGLLGLAIRHGGQTDWSPSDATTNQRATIGLLPWLTPLGVSRWCNRACRWAHKREHAGSGLHMSSRVGYSSKAASGHGTFKWSSVY